MRQKSHITNFSFLPREATAFYQYHQRKLKHSKVVENPQKLIINLYLGFPFLLKFTVKKVISLKNEQNAI